MIKSFWDYIQPTGHLQISKVLDDGSEQVIFDDQNVIVSGFGAAMGYLFTLSGSNSIVDFQIDRAQLGVSGNDVDGSSIYQLSGPLTSIAEYGANSNLNIVETNQIRPGDESEELFIKIPFNKVTRITDTAVRYTIVLDKEAANDITRGPGSVPHGLNEIGLFMKNPRGNIPDYSLLVAYKRFSDIEKTSDFGLVFRWTISF